MLLKYPICDCRLAKVLACARLAVGLLWLVGVTALNVSAQIYSELVREALQQPAQTSAPQNDQKTSHPSPTAPPAPDDKVTSHNPQDDDAAKINIFTGMGHAHGGAYQPLTGKQRWQLYLNQTFLPPAYFGIAWSSLVDHLSNQPPEWGHGASGLGLRVASRFGSNVVGGTLLGAGAALTGEDPRYIRSDDHGFWRRGRHAIAFTVLTYNREGETRPAIAGVSSLYASSVITQLWLPNHDHLWRDGMRDGTVSATGLQRDV